MTIAPEISKTPESRLPRSQTAESPPLWQALRAIIVKELRQNMVVLALVIGLEFLIAFFCQYFNNGSLLDLGRRYDNILLYSATAQGVTFCSIVAAFLLGLFQPFAERQFDVWAFLVHRPVPRSVLFLGRMIAGLMMYGIATGLPILILCMIASTPSGGEFFLWQYTLPSIADFFVSIPFYFVGMLIAEREARLYGSRLLPIALAAAVSIASFSIHSFIAAVSLALGVALLLAIVCEGSAISHGYVLSAPRRSRLALFLLLICGFSIIALTGANTARSEFRSEISTSLQFYLNGKPSERGIVTTTSHELLRNGILVTRVEKDVPYNGDEYESRLSTEYFSPDGRLLPLPKDPVEAEKQFAPSIFAFAKFWWNRSTYYNHNRAFRAIEGLAESFSVHIENIDYPTEEWYFVPSRNIFYIYARPNGLKPELTERFLGTFGVNGFVPVGNTALPFEGSLSQSHFQSPHALYKIDYINKKLILLYQTPADETILHWDFQVSPRTPDSDLAVAPLQILTNRRCLFTDSAGKVQVELPITHDLNAYVVSVRQTDEMPTWVVRYYHPDGYEGHIAPATDSPDVWEFYDTHGHLISSQKFADWVLVSPPRRIPSLQSDPYPNWLNESIHRDNIKEGLVIALANPLFIFLHDVTAGPLTVGFQRFPYDDYTPEEYRYPLWSLATQWWIVLPALGVMSLSSLLGWLLAKLFRAKHRFAWTLLAFLCGPIALLTLLTFETWPRYARCPHCKKLRPLREDLCPRCRAQWPVPVPNATEIFA